MAESFADRFNRILKEEKQKAFNRSDVKVDPVAYQKTLDFLKSLEKPSKKGSASPTGEGSQRDNLEQLLTQPENQEVKKAGDEWNLGSFFPNIAKKVGGAIKATPLDESVLFAIDQISRPAHATFEGMKERSESLREGQSELEAVDDILGGIWSGFSLNERTGYGEVVEENYKRALEGQTPKPGLLGTILDQGMTIKDLPDPLQHPAKIAAGAAGEIGFDPLNLVGGAAVATTGKAVKAGSEIAEGASKVQKLKRVLPVVEDAKIYNPTEYIYDTQKAVREAAKETNWADFLFKTKMAPAGRGIDGGKIATNQPVRLQELDKLVEDSIFDATIQINKGANAYKVIGAEHAPNLTASRVASRAREMVTESIDVNRTKYLDHANGKTILKVDKLKGLDKRVLEEYQKEILKKGYKFEKRLNPSTKVNLMNDAIDNVLADFDTQVKDLYDNIVNRLAGEVWNSPGIRVGNKRIPFERVGKAYADVKGKHLSGDSFESLSHTKQFKGRTQLLNRRVSSLGVRNYENWHVGDSKTGLQNVVGIRNGEPSLVSMANTVNKNQREALNRSLLNRARPSDDRMAAAYDWLIDEYDAILRDELDAGLIGKIDPKTGKLTTGSTADNYINLYFPRGNPRKIREFKNEINAYIAKNGSIPDDVFERAKKRGLKPTEDAFEALTFRKLKSIRRLTESWFLDDLMDHYGVVTKRQSTQLKDWMDLKDITESLPLQTKQAFKESGQRAYLPVEIADIFGKYRDLARSQNVEGWLRTIDSVTRMFKFSATIPFPGFHIRNAMGDMFMSFLDGVKPSTYSKTTRYLRNGANNPNYTVTLNGHEHNFENLKNLFNSHTRTGGFFRTDLGTSELGNVVFDPNSLGRKAYSGVRRASEVREDFFRFSHFLHAYGEEFAALSKQIKDPKLLERNAVENASFRVNKYLFDYSALTKTERDKIRRLIPFYTYQRKVLPTVLESLYLSPRNIAVTGRMFNPEGRDSEQFNPMLIPEYHRESGYAVLDNQEEPWIFSAVGLPIDPVRENTTFSDPADWLRNVLGQSNPAIKFPIEVAGQRSLFNERVVDDPAVHLQDSFFPPIAALEDTLTPEDGKLAEFFTSRLGLGLPIDKVTQNQLDATLYDKSADVQRQLGDLNRSLFKNKGFRIYLSNRKDGANFRIRNEETEEVIFESNNVNELIKVAKTLND